MLQSKLWIYGSVEEGLCQDVVYRIFKGIESWPFVGFSKNIYWAEDPVGFKNELLMALLGRAEKTASESKFSPTLGILIFKVLGYQSLALFKYKIEFTSHILMS